MKEVGKKLNEMMPRLQIVDLEVYNYRLTRTLLDAMMKDRPALFLEQLLICTRATSTPAICSIHPRV